MSEMSEQEKEIRANVALHNDDLVGRNEIKDLLSINDQLRADNERLEEQLKESERIKHNLLENSNALARHAKQLQLDLQKVHELLTEIRDDEVNAQDEADKFLRNHELSELSRVKVDLRQRISGMDLQSNHPIHGIGSNTQLS